MQPVNDQIKAGEIARDAILLARELCKEQMSAEHLEKKICNFILLQGGEPGLRGYKPTFSSMPYEYAMCLCLNNEVVHGCPVAKIINPFDIITIDLVVKFGEYYADSARTFSYSNDNNIKRLINKSWEVFTTGLLLIKPKMKLKSYGKICRTLAELNKLCIVREFSGHCIGKEIHLEPQVLNYDDGIEYQEAVFEPDKAYAIEPVLAERPYALSKSNDGWTYTANCLSTHFEDTIWVGEDRIVNLTR